jgi:transglutaminase-like putative cysteine protease
VRGACDTFTNAFQFLCDMAGIPAIAVQGDNHAWAMVYVDGDWLHCDPTNNLVLAETIRYTPCDPMRVLFAQEVHIPGSTV